MTKNSKIKLRKRVNNGEEKYKALVEKARDVIYNLQLKGKNDGK
ncbi:MAG: hypothetical protein ABIA17_04045 [Elusimicrobiota bacterium]